MKDLKDYDEEEEKATRQVNWVVRIVIVLLLILVCGIYTMINQSIILGGFATLLIIGCFRLDYWTTYGK